MMRRHHRPGSRERGFTLAELLVSITVLTQILLIALLIFDTSSRVNRVQIRLAEMQQSLRVGQHELISMTRLAGRSGLPVTGDTGSAGNPLFLPFGRAVAVLNNVDGASRKVAPNDDDSPMAVAGSDILVLRGNFSTPLFHGTLTSLNSAREDATEGTITIPLTTPFIQQQNLAPLVAVNEGNIPEALILLPSGPGQEYAVVELRPLQDNNYSDRIELAFTIKGGSSDLANTYRSLWTNDLAARFPLGAGAGCSLAILEEHRFYVRNDGGDAAQEARPRLSRARLLPATGLAHGLPGLAPNPLVLRTDLADGILDLQVSLGFDTVTAGLIGRGDVGAITETFDGQDDDWLFNALGEDPGIAPFTVVDAASVPRLYYLRISTMARTLGADRQHQEEIVQRLEDHVFPQDSGWVNSTMGRKYRRRTLTTTVDLRNL